MQLNAFAVLSCFMSYIFMVYWAEFGFIYWLFFKWLKVKCWIFNAFENQV